MPDDPSPFPAPLSDAHLRETLDLLAGLVASVSDRADAQTEALGRMSKTAAVARKAAFATKAQTDPKAYGDSMGQTISEHLDDIRHLSGALRQTVLQVDRILKEVSKNQGHRLHVIHLREQKVDRFWARTRWLALGLSVLFALLLMIVPRIVALHPTGCTLLGGTRAFSRTTGRVRSAGLSGFLG